MNYYFSSFLQQQCRITGTYNPILFFDYFWSLKSSWIQINETVTALPLDVSFSPISLFKFQMQATMEHTWEQQKNGEGPLGALAMASGGGGGGSGGSGGGGMEDDTQEFKRMLLETNPWLLGLTMVVSTLHMVFDMLAFRNDIAFWKDNKSTEGLSVRSIFVSAVTQLIVFLYLMDNETSWMILFSAGVGVAIEFWKITKAGTLEAKRTFPFFSFTDKAGYQETETAKYDREAMRYVRSASRGAVRVRRAFACTCIHRNECMR